MKEIKTHLQLTGRLLTRVLLTGHPTSSYPLHLHRLSIVHSRVWRGKYVCRALIFFIQRRFCQKLFCRNIWQEYLRTMQPFFRDIFDDLHTIARTSQPTIAIAMQWTMGNGAHCPFSSVQKWWNQHVLCICHFWVGFRQIFNSVSRILALSSHSVHCPSVHKRDMSIYASIYRFRAFMSVYIISTAERCS